jgi:hypothetical protein
VGEYASTTLPGFINPAGSQIVLNSRNASTSDSPKDVVNRLEADWTSLEDLHHFVCGAKDVGKSEHQQALVTGCVDETNRRFEHRGTRAFGSDQGSRQIEPPFRQQGVELESGDAARDLREAGPDLGDMPACQRAQIAADLFCAAVFTRAALDAPPGCPADCQVHAVAGEDFEFLDGIRGRPSDHRVDAAGVVADHAAERAPGVCCGIRTVHQVMRRERPLQIVEDDTGLNARGSSMRIDGHDAPQVPRHVHDHGGVAALPREARAGATRQDSHVVLAARLDRLDDVFDRTRPYHADRRLTVVGGVGRIQGASSSAEIDLAGDLRAKDRFERHTSSRTLSERTVKAIFSRFGWPLTSDCANRPACSTVTFGGIGGVYGSTTASTITGPFIASA